MASTSSDIQFSSNISVRPIQKMGGDSMVAAAAWVSTSGEEAAERIDDDPEHFRGLIRSLMKMKHGSVFEHSSMTFFCHAPIFVWREWHRHRIGFSYNEQSGRYMQLEPVFWIPRFDRPMMKPENHRAMRPKYDSLEDIYTNGDTITPMKVYGQMLRNSHDVCSLAYQRYEEEIAMGVANEVARRHLPLSIYSSCWVTCNPRSLMDFLSLRTHEPAAAYPSYPQAEIEEAARVAEQFLAEGWPLTYEFFNKFGRVAP